MVQQALVAIREEMEFPWVPASRKDDRPLDWLQVLMRMISVLQSYDPHILMLCENLFGSRHSRL